MAVRGFGLPEQDWEASEIAKAVAGLAPYYPVEAVELLRVAAELLFPEDPRCGAENEQPPEGRERPEILGPARPGPPRIGPRRALLASVAKAAPLLARSLGALSAPDSARAVRQIVETALILYLACPDEAQVPACYLSMVIQKSDVPGAREFSGSSAQLSRALALVATRLPEALSRGDQVSASCALFMLRYHVLSSWMFRRHCSTTPEYGAFVEGAIRLAREGIAREASREGLARGDEAPVGPKPMSRPAGLAFLAASSALLLARASPSFPLRSPGVGAQLWALAELPTDPRTSATASLALFYFHALRGPEGGEAARTFVSYISGRETLKEALPFCRTASRLAMYWKDGSMADGVCAAMKRLLDRGPASPEDAGRAVRLLESGMQSREVAAELVRAAISRAAEPQEETKS